MNTSAVLDLPNLSQYLTCFKQNGTAIYPDSTFNCALITQVNTVLESHSSLKLFPNPFHTSATVILTVKNAVMEVYNTFGQLAQEERINNYTTVIHRNSLANGLYFYRLIQNKEILFRGKFIIE